MAEKKEGFFSKLKKSLEKTKSGIFGKLGGLFQGGRAVDEDFLEELEDILISADIGVATTEKLMAELRRRIKEDKLRETGQVRQALQSIALSSVRPQEGLSLPDKSLILVVGVNGVGKTTAIGKLAAKYKAEGRKVLLAAGDTFRAAASEQLAIWGERAGVDVIRHGEGGDPAAVIFDGINAAKARGADILICDTAGRLQNKKNLMQELGKIGRVTDREWPEARRETFLVLDAGTGQNAISQAREFMNAVNITGLILTKLDGTAKGGVVLAIMNELNIPVRYIGTGEGIDDIAEFDPESFISALFGE